MPLFCGRSTPVSYNMLSLYYVIVVDMRPCRCAYSLRNAQAEFGRKWLNLFLGILRVLGLLNKPISSVTALNNPGESNSASCNAWWNLTELTSLYIQQTDLNTNALKGALSRYFSVILQFRNMFLHQWKPKNNDAVLLHRTLSLHRNHLLLTIT